MLSSRNLYPNGKIDQKILFFVICHLYQNSQHSEQWLDHKLKVLVAQSCPNLCDSMDSSLPGFSAHEILQARILEWEAIPFSTGSS